MGCNGGRPRGLVRSKRDPLRTNKDLLVSKRDLLRTNKDLLVGQTQRPGEEDSRTLVSFVCSLPYRVGSRAGVSRNTHRNTQSRVKLPYRVGSRGGVSYDADLTRSL